MPQREDGSFSTAVGDIVFAIEYSPYFLNLKFARNPCRFSSAYHICVLKYHISDDAFGPINCK